MRFISTAVEPDAYLYTNPDSYLDTGSGSKHQNPAAVSKYT